MAEDGDRGALTLLTIVTIIAAAALLVGTFALARESNGLSLFIGLGGLCVGILVAATWQMHRQRRQVEKSDALLTLVERLQALEGEQERVAELEERVDFAERMLAKPDASRAARQEG
ncbi:MAG TPA: hypothetical protein VFL88_12070 [Gemmatimonadales bacterium]|jgi:hypothetical protein|nr:hypothetical protein [Gemmatimonadales bacterium]